MDISELLRKYAQGDRNFSHLTLNYANLQGITLKGANLSESDLRESDLKGADLEGADLSRSNLEDADVRNANLQGVNFTAASLSGASLRQANLKKAILRGANLAQSDLSGADLSDADLQLANLTDAKLDGANLNGAIFAPSPETPPEQISSDVAHIEESTPETPISEPVTETQIELTLNACAKRAYGIAQVEPELTLPPEESSNLPPTSSPEVIMEEPMELFSSQSVLMDEDQPMELDAQSQSSADLVQLFSSEEETTAETPTPATPPEETSEKPKPFAWRLKEKPPQK